MRRLAVAALLASALATSGCTIDTAVAGGWRVSPKLADACVDHCHVLNMRLAAVVVVHATGGCVCEPLDRAASTSSGGGAVAGGAVVQVMEQRAAGAAAVGSAGAIGAAHR